LGPWCEAVVRLGGGLELTVRTTGGTLPAVGQRRRVQIGPDAIMCWAGAMDGSVADVGAAAWSGPRGP
ncbi:MAG: hypothetical protein ACRDYD_08940, partial [Acidimicrobiales bacterium]